MKYIISILLCGIPLSGWILAAMAGAARSGPGYGFYQFLFIISLAFFLLQIWLVKQNSKSFFTILALGLNLLILLAFIPLYNQYSEDQYTWCNRIDLGLKSGCQLSKMIEFLEEEGKEENFTVTKVIDNSVIESIRGLLPSEFSISEDRTHLIQTFRHERSGKIYGFKHIYITSAGLVYVGGYNGGAIDIIVDRKIDDGDAIDFGATFGTRKLIKY